MALVTYVSSGVYDDHVGSATIHPSTNVSISTGITSAGVTAPNLTNKITGCWIYVNSAPVSGTMTVAILESGVSKATVTANASDLRGGFNYFRFTTPYQFATLTALAYTARVTTSLNTGNLRIAASGLWFAYTYDTARALGATDDIWVGGFNNAGMTPQTLTASGTAMSFGSGTTGITNNITATMGAALTIGNGGSFVFDTSASTTVTIKGSVFTTMGGLYDQRGSSNKARVNTVIIDSTAVGDQMFLNALGTSGGQFLMTGATYDVYTTYASGLGTAASPMIVQTAWDADVNDEIVIGGGTDYLKNETKYIKTRNSSTSFVLSDTPGGAEAALVNTHTAGSHMNNMTRNVVVKPLDTTKGCWMYMGGTGATSDFSYSRWEYVDSASKGIAANQGTPASIDGMVIYNSSSGNRYILNIGQGTTNTQTITGVTLYNTRGVNYTSQSGAFLSACSNKTLNDFFFYNAPTSTLGCGFLSVAGSSTGNTFNNCHSYGANGSGSSGGYALGMYSSAANTFNNCTFNATRSVTNSPALSLNATQATVFNNCKFGNIATNTVDITPASSTLNQGVFNACYFSSATLILNYLNQLDSSLLAFQDMDGSTSKHRWYTNYGSWWSAGSGLTDTTVRTAGSLSLVSKPENNTLGSSWTYKIPAAPSSKVLATGYVYRNATFSSGTLKAELFLPGTLLTGTPDATYTFPTTTGSWLDFTLSAQYNGTVARYATVKITGVTSTPGAYFFVDDLFDAGINNKVAGFDLWDEGQPSKIMVVTDFSSAVPVLTSAVWNDTASYPAGSKGKNLKDASKVKLLL